VLKLASGSEHLGPGPRWTAFLSVLEDLDLSRIGDPYARECIVRLLNLVEKLAIEVRTLQEENQRLQDENARLKGEKGKPDIKANGRSGLLLRSVGHAGRASEVMGR